MVITGLSEKPLGLPRPTPKDTQDMSEYEVFAKVPNLFFFQSVFHFISSKAFDFRIFFQNPRHFCTARGAQATQALSTTAGRAIARSGVYIVED